MNGYYKDGTTLNNLSKEQVLSMLDCGYILQTRGNNFIYKYEDSYMYSPTLERLDKFAEPLRSAWRAQPLIVVRSSTFVDFNKLAAVLS